MELLLNFILCGVNIYFDSSGSCQSNVIVLCNTHYQRDAPQPPLLLLLHTCPTTPSATAPLLLQCCTSATVWLCNHWVRLHCCTLPVLLLKLLLWLGLGWVEEFKLSLSLELAWLGVPWLGYLGGNIWNIPLIFLLCFKEKVNIIRITIKVYGESLVIVIIHWESTF